MTKEECKKDINWCSKHQTIHAPHTWYRSCRFPNRKEKTNDKIR